MIFATNRHLLLALGGFGLLNVVLCLVVVLRENSNGGRIAQLVAESDSAREKERLRFEVLDEELRNARDALAGELRKTRDELAQTVTALTKTRGKLEAARTDLDQARAALAIYQGKPWLNQPGNKPPWETQLQQLNEQVARLEKALKELKPMPPKDKPPGPDSK
jgi:hypothetical protein